MYSREIQLYIVLYYYFSHVQSRKLAIHLFILVRASLVLNENIVKIGLSCA